MKILFHMHAWKRATGLLTQAFFQTQRSLQLVLGQTKTLKPVWLIMFGTKALDRAVQLPLCLQSKIKLED